MAKKKTTKTTKTTKKTTPTFIITTSLRKTPQKSKVVAK